MIAQVLGLGRPQTRVGKPQTRAIHVDSAKNGRRAARWCANGHEMQYLGVQYCVPEMVGSTDDTKRKVWRCPTCHAVDTETD